MEIKLIIVSIGLISLIALVYYVISWNFRKPIVGGTYVLSEDRKNPFNKTFVKVLEVRGGYVRYVGNHSEVEMNNKVFTFNSLYSKTDVDITW